MLRPAGAAGDFTCPHALSGPPAGVTAGGASHGFVDVQSAGHVRRRSCYQQKSVQQTRAPLSVFTLSPDGRHDCGQILSKLTHVPGPDLISHDRFRADGPVHVT